MGRVVCYEPIHGGPLDGGERYGDRPFPWRPDIQLAGFSHEGHWFDILPRPEGRRFPLHRSQPMRTYMHTGLAASRWADTALQWATY